MATAIWLKDDLRIEDNRAVALALSEGCKDFIYVTDPDDSHVPKTKRRLLAENSALENIQMILGRAGIKLHHLIGQSAPEIEAFCLSKGIHKLFSNQQTGDMASFHRDISVSLTLRKAGIAFVETPNDGIARGSQNTPGPYITPRDRVSILQMETPYAIKKLWNFLGELPSRNYRENMWCPGKDSQASSRLSTDIAIGALSIDRTLHMIRLFLEKNPEAPRQPYNQFKARLEWRRSFVQLFEQEVDAFPWGPMREERPNDRAFEKAWLNGETGYPLVDAAMIDLGKNGWLNFRLRQVVASFALNLLDLDIHRTGVMLGSLFDDYCPGIHWPQIALQGGMVQSRGPRIINPIKQARELDPDGKYVRGHLPYLRNIGDHYIHEPWLDPSYKGPEPIVEYHSAAKAARAKYPGKKSS